MITQQVNKFQVIEQENNVSKFFDSSRDVSFFLSGRALSDFKIIKNGREVSLEYASKATLNNILRIA